VFTHITGSKDPRVEVDGSDTCFWEAWLKASIQTEGYDGGWDGKWEVTIGFLLVSDIPIISDSLITHLCPI
jgi:hypothetical protein